jgi:integrase
MTQFGKPYSADGFGGWFARKCKAAGVKGRAHGLRKLAAIRMAYADATVPQLMAWGGWKTQTEPLRYIQQAQRAKLADMAAKKLSNAQRKNRQKSR